MAASAEGGKGGSGAGAVCSSSSARFVGTYVGNETTISEMPRENFVHRPPSKLQEFTLVDDKPSENAVQCDACNKWTRSFKFMMTVKVCEKKEQFLGDMPDKEISRRTCAPCLAKEMGESLASAITDICNQRVRYERGRCKKYDAAKAQIREKFAFVADNAGDKWSNRFLKVLARTDFAKIFAPWARIMILDTASMDAAVGFIQEFDIFMAVVKSIIEQGISAQEINEQMRKIDDIETRTETSKAVAVAPPPPPLSPPLCTPPGRTEVAASAEGGNGGSSAGAAGSSSSAGSVRTDVGNEGTISEAPRKKFVDLTPSKLQEFTPVDDRPSENAVQCRACMPDK